MNGVEPCPLVSVIIPVHNGERFLGEAIASVLDQNYPSLELIVVDDGSTDGSAAVAVPFGNAVRCVSQPQSGPGPARNHGVRLARGEYLAFLDADDLWVPGTLSPRLEVFAENRDAGLVFGHVQQFRSSSLDPGVAARLQCPSEPEPGFVPGALLLRREVFERVGPFEARWRVGEFMDWYLRAGELGLSSVMLPIVVLRRRLHENNLGLRQPGANADFLRILKLSLNRRRAAAGRGSNA